MPDRKIVKTDTTSMSNWTNRHYSASTGALITTETGTYPANRYIRERIPTGGKSIPETEKPFTNGTLIVNFPVGALTRNNYTGGSIWRSTGSHANSFTMRDSGEGLTGFLEFPMGGTRYPKANSSAIYPPGVNADLLSQAEVKALNKLRDKGIETTLDVGLMWAERRETTKLFAECTQAMLKLALALKRKDASAAVDVLLDDFRLTFSGMNPAKAKRKLIRDTKAGLRGSGKLLTIMSNLVLGWNLGVSPLLKDLGDAHTLLQTGLLTRDWNLKSVSRYSRTVNDRDVNTWPLTGVESTTTVSEVHGYTVTLIGRPNFSTTALLGALGLNSPASLIYQATSLTFIIDYFHALGPWLDSLAVAGEFDFTGGSWTQKVSRIVTQVIKSASGTMEGDYTLNYVCRKLYGAFPVPIPPLSLRERQLTDKQMLNTGLVALSKLKELLR